ncbi:hypothetical protein GCM10027598_04730 [Amycolatopsis oliviviridis]|uniref:Uncharacterized protein n=2 Tax=Amycolatopsis oliviviridis TaxID=1471590 RepID=A0ABQ3LLA1_9PSEU|nr:hypothetical protein GCM10017790_38120 [Amycolatopsis oliviviridis]
MLLALALAFDVPPLPHLDTDDLISLLPSEHRGWLGTWRPGKGLPVFTPAFRPGGEPSWNLAAEHLSDWLTTTSKTTALHLANDEVATHVTAKALADAGLHTGLASVTSTGRGLHYESQPEIDLTVVFMSDHVGSSRRELLELLQRLLSLRKHARDRAIGVLLIEPRLLQRLDVLLPGCAVASTGDTVRVPPSTLQEIEQADPGSFPPEIEMILLASERSPTAHATYIYEISKVESVSTPPR